MGVPVLTKCQIVDYIQTLDLEIALIWNAKWSIVKMLFLIARYPTFLDISLVLYVTLSHHQSDKNCAVAYDISSVITLIGIGAAEVIFVLRTYALWGNNKNLLRFLVSQVIVIYIPEIVCLALFLRSLEYGSPPLPSVAGCYQTAGSDIIFINFVLLLYHEAVLMVLTVWVGIKRYRHSSNPLITTLYRDGILYFVWLFIISAANIFVLAAGPVSYLRYQFLSQSH
ncbi:hypothetical protein BDZ97DRAFT_1647266 [Flammula alnicola]|nr:hypothetical protein BDZ97DRAFT_1647266 [Flammula alnicola]